ncbi:hypothetical protein E2C01_004785 [Portunus trituberculatus]|uniref:Uncharacterized protein n=1 Tax=Portunus trituberculatus TaxID=210409 RepID=A0A5B7CQK6_PORTR|nr:hypothetical protein [Portunus trituberculatus]
MFLQGKIQEVTSLRCVILSDFISLEFSLWQLSVCKAEKELKSSFDTVLLFGAEGKRYLSTVDPRRSNWTRYLRPAPDRDSANLVVVLRPILDHNNKTHHIRLHRRLQNPDSHDSPSSWRAVVVVAPKNHPPFPTLVAVVGEAHETPWEPAPFSPGTRRRPGGETVLTSGSNNVLQQPGGGAGVNVGPTLHSAYDVAPSRVW